MEPSKEAIAVRITRLNRQIIGKVTSGTSKLSRKIDRETLLDALTVLYDECNDDPVKKCDELVRTFLDKYRSTLADLKRARVCISDFELIHIIGRGHYGEVHMVREKQTADVYALKSIRKDEARKRVSGAEDERDILATAAGCWIPRLQYAFQDATNLYLVMELCNGGDLAGLLARRNNPLSERDAAFYIAEVAHALKTLHGMGYVHRDVKPQNILLDRCGHVKLADFGSCARLSEGGCVTGATADYVAPELLGDCSGAHTVCLEYCRRVNTAISACDYWSLGVIAFELVTLNRPFSSGDDDSTAQILSNIQKYERDPNAEPPFEAPPGGPSSTWRGLVSGLLRVAPARRFNYLDTLQHAALAHLALHAIRDQVPPWVPHIRGPEDTSYLASPTREVAPPSAAPFRTRPPFAGHLPFVGYSYVAIEEKEDNSSGFNASHDCTAIDLATFKSAEKLAALRGREVASLQSKLAAAEAAAGAAAERARAQADADAERLRARLQADITALTLQNKRLERQIEVEREERMALQRTNQELSCGLAERSGTELRAAQARARDLQAERDQLKEECARAEARVRDLQAECSSALAATEAARAQQKHYKETVAKERALRRQTLSGGDADARLATAEATAAREMRARRDVDERLAASEREVLRLRADADDLSDRLAAAQESIAEKERLVCATNQQLNEAQVQLAQERMRVTTLTAQVQELERGVSAAGAREAALEEQCARTEARLVQRLEAAEARAAAALHDDARHREKVTSLEQLVRQLEREVSALENRTCTRCASREAERAVSGAPTAVSSSTNTEDAELDARSDTESVSDAHLQAQVTLLKEQLERAEAQLQARADELAALRQEARAANLARWRKEKEYNDLSLDAKVTARDLKKLEERLASAVEARRSAEDKAGLVHREITTLKPQYEQLKKESQMYKEQLEKLQKTNEILQAEVDRSRNDIRKLKSELQYSEKRRQHAEQQEELSARERAQLRDELQPLRARSCELAQVGFRVKSELQYSEKRRQHAEQQEELSARERAQLRDELQPLRARSCDLAQVGFRVKSELQYSDKRRQHAEQQEELSARERAQLRDELQPLRARSCELAQVGFRVKSELQYSEKRRQHAEQQEELSARERAQLRDELQPLRARSCELAQVGFRVKSELQYSDKRRQHAEQQEELSARERAQLRDELQPLRARSCELAQVGFRVKSELQYSDKRRQHAEQQEELSARERAQLRDELQPLRARSCELAQVGFRVKSELQYSDKRRQHAEQQEELSARERAQLRDELQPLRARSCDLAQVGFRVKSELQYSDKRRQHAEQQEELSARERAQLRDELQPLRARSCELAQVGFRVKSELQYSDKRRQHAEQQEELSARERAQLRDELQPLRARSCELAQVGFRVKSELQYSDKRRQHAEQQEELSARERAQLRDELQPLRARSCELAQVGFRVKSELQYSDKRRQHAEQQEELSARERAQLRDELQPLRARSCDLAQNNEALQEACALLEEQLNDLEKLTDLHEMKNKDLENEATRLRSELEATRTKLSEAERQATAATTTAELSDQRAADLAEQLRLATSQLDVMRERLENRDRLVEELEARVGTLQGEAAAKEAALSGAARRLRELQEEAAGLRTRAHHHHERALQLQAALADAQEEAEAAREAHEAATAWWRTRETKADGTLRQQAKLIDFLQAKVEEAGRKKCSLSNKLFGRSGRRAAASPPLLRVNRELREEVERLRAKLAAANANSDVNFPPTPRRDRKDNKPKKIVNGSQNLNTSEGNDDTLLVIWADGSRERVQARCSSKELVLGAGDGAVRARLQAETARGLPHNEANRAFTVKLEYSDRGTEAAIVCSSIAERSRWISLLTPSTDSVGFNPPTLLQCQSQPTSALYFAPDTLAIGCPDGLQSLRGPVRLQWADAFPARAQGVATLCAAGGRALLALGGPLAHAPLAALSSALRRACALRPALELARVPLPDAAPPHLVRGIDEADGLCAAVACGRRVFLLRYDAATAEFKIARSLTIDRPPHALLLTSHTLYISGEKPLKVKLPSGSLESFAMDEPIVNAAFKRQSPPLAILLIRSRPVEILLCYAECGVFVDESGRRTRNEDPKWSSAVNGWEFVHPFLYAIGENKITIIYISDETYRAPPCTCDSASMTSSASECYQPEIFNYKLNEPYLLGTAPNGIIIRSKIDDEYRVSILEGMAAFRSIGASLESLNTVSDPKGSSSDLAQSLTDISPQDDSQESVELTTGFLADIRNRARQLRMKNRQEATPDDVIKEILTTEVGLKRTSNGRKSPAIISECETDTEPDSDDGTGSTKCTADVCAEMFTRQVRFQ